MFCPNCGKQIDDDSKFCFSCGKPISDVKEQSVSTNLYLGKEQDDILNQAKKSANKTVLQGIIWFIVGAIITGITYAMVAESGGTYFIVWGPMIIGIGLIISGVYYRIFPKKYINQLIKKVEGQKNKPQ